MWQVSVIFVPTMTGLYPIPMLWCGVRGETVKKKLIFSSRQRFVQVMSYILNILLVDALIMKLTGLKAIIGLRDVLES